MEIMNERAAAFAATLIRLHEALELFEESAYSHIYTTLRDSAIQRFEFSIDLFWKCLKDYLLFKNGTEASSPKNTIKACLDAGIITEKEYPLLLQMIEDRNLASHTYDESFSEELTLRLQQHYTLMYEINQRLLIKQQKV